MKEKKVFVGLLVVLALAASLVLAGCLGTDDDSSSGGNPFVGIWNGYLDWDRIRIVADQTNWTLSYPDHPGWGSEYGTYTHSGNTATMYQSGIQVGTATISGNTLTLNIAFYGTVFLTK